MSVDKSNKTSVYTKKRHIISNSSGVKVKSPARLSNNFYYEGNPGAAAATTIDDADDDLRTRSSTDQQAQKMSSNL